MAFSQNNAAAQGGLKPEGRYETIITSIDEKATKNGKQYLNSQQWPRSPREEQEETM